jgi:hypothetical protein
MPWIIAQDDNPEKVLAQHGWTSHRPAAMEFMSQEDAQAHIDNRRAPGHPAQLTAAEKQSWSPGAVSTDYDPFGFGGARP